MKRLIGLVMTLVMVVSLSAPAVHAQTTDAPAPTRTAAQSTPVLTVSLPNFWRDMIDVDGLVADFEAQYAVDLEVVYQDVFFGGGPGAGAATAAFETAESLASSADVVYVDTSSVGILATRAGYFLDLAPLVNSDSGLNINDFYPAIWQSFQWDNSVWAIPTSASLLSMSYNSAAFDSASLPYPSSSWSLRDWMDAARQLTTYASDGSVETPGMMTGFGSSEFGLLLRAALGEGFYDSSTFPELPRLNTPELQALLTEWLALIDDGVISNGFSENFDAIPIRLGGNFVRGGGAGGPDQVQTEFVAPFPNGMFGVQAQGFAISSGTRYPELAYALASFLSQRAEIGQSFLGDVAARQSLETASATTTDNGTGGAAGGGPVFRFDSTLDATLQAEVDAGLPNALPASELRFADYVTAALDTMQRDSIDASQALQDAEAQAVSDLAAAETQRAAVNVIVATPERFNVPAGESILETGYSYGVGGGIRVVGGGMPNEDGWDAVNDSFAAADPAVGLVTIEVANAETLAELSEQYDCFITSTNLATSEDLSPLMSLDPFIDADFNFDRNSIIGNVLSELQGADGRTWGYPLTIEPQTLSVDTELFAQAGLDIPSDGWTIDEFVDALDTLYTMTGEAPYQPNEPSGIYLLWLIAAFGGLPIDYSTDPVTINYTDPATVAAIQQVLDLAKNGYFEYTALASQGGVFSVRIGGGGPDEAAIPISGNFNIGGFGPGGPRGGGQFQPTTVDVPYPYGNTYTPISFTTTAGYISAQADDPAACYRWFGEVAKHPDLMGGVPASNTNSAAVSADSADLMAYLDSIMDAPSTIVFEGQRLGFGGAGGTTYWLYRAFDRYVNDDADLAYELSEAQVFTTEYLACMAGVDTSGGITPDLFEQLQACATTVDPTFGQ